MGLSEVGLWSFGSGLVAVVCFSLDYLSGWGSVVKGDWTDFSSIFVGILA